MVAMPFEDDDGNDGANNYTSIIPLRQFFPLTLALSNGKDMC